MENSSSSGIFRGWVVLAGLFVTMTVTSGLGFYAQGVFLDALVVEQGFSVGVAGAGIIVIKVVETQPAVAIGSSNAGRKIDEGATIAVPAVVQPVTPDSKALPIVQERPNPSKLWQIRTEVELDVCGGPQLTIAVSAMGLFHVYECWCRVTGVRGI